MGLCTVFRFMLIATLPLLVVSVQAAAAPLEIHVGELTTSGTVVGHLPVPEGTTIVRVMPLTAGPLEVNPQTGELRLKFDARLNFESCPQLEQTFEIWTQRQQDDSAEAFAGYLIESGTSAIVVDELRQVRQQLMVRLLVDDQPEPPTLLSRSRYILRWNGLPLRTLPLAWQCVDPDHGDSLSFTLKSTGKQFVLNAQSGVLTATPPTRAIDAAEESQLQLRALDRSGQFNEVCWHVLCIPAYQPVLAHQPVLAQVTPPLPVVADSAQPLEETTTPSPLSPALENNSTAAVQPVTTPPMLEQVGATVGTAVQVAANAPAEGPHTNNSESTQRNLLVGSVKLIGTLTLFAFITVIAMLLYAGRFFRHRQPVGAPVEVEQVEPELKVHEGFELSNTEMQELLWGQLPLVMDTDDVATDQLVAAALSSSVSDFSAVTEMERVALQPLPLAVREATSQAFRLPGPHAPRVSVPVPDAIPMTTTTAVRQSPEVETAAISEDEGDELARELAALEAANSMVGFRLEHPPATDEALQFQLDAAVIDKGSETEVGTSTIPFVEAGPAGESTIEEWLRRVAPGFQSKDYELTQSTPDFQILNDLADVYTPPEDRRDRRLPDGYRDQQRTELEAFRQVAISATELRVLEEEHEEQTKSWTPVASTVLACLVIGTACIDFNWFGWTALIVGWPLVGVGSLILFRHLATWIPTRRRLAQHIIRICGVENEFNGP